MLIYFLWYTGNKGKCISPIYYLWYTGSMVSMYNYYMLSMVYRKQEWISTIYDLWCTGSRGKCISAICYLWYTGSRNEYLLYIIYGVQEARVNMYLYLLYIIYGIQEARVNVFTISFSGPIPSGCSYRGWYSLTLIVFGGEGKFTPCLS